MTDYDSSYDNDRAVPLPDGLENAWPMLDDVPLPNIPGEPIDLTGVTVSMPPGFNAKVRVSNNWPLSEAVSGKVWVLLGKRQYGGENNILGVFTSQESAVAEEGKRQSRDDDYDIYSIEEWELNKPAAHRQWWKNTGETDAQP